MQMNAKGSEYKEQLTYCCEMKYSYRYFAKQFTVCFNAVGEDIETYLSMVQPTVARHSFCRP